MAVNPEADVEAALAGAAGAATLVSATNLFRGPVREQGGTVPAEAVFCTGAGGANPEPYLPSSSGSWLRAFVRVTVRSGLDDYAGGHALARACWAKLYLATITDATWCKPLASEPDFDGQDERGLFNFSFTVEVAFKATP